MKTGIITFSQFHGRQESGSSRIRARWLVENWQKSGPDLGDAELYKLGQKYDCVIYQKVYWPEHAKLFKGVKILDLCDPDWLNWTYKFKEMIEEVDAITCSSFEIAKAVVAFTDKPVVFLPDRIDLENLPKPKVHQGDLKTVVWFGYPENFPMVDASCTAIIKRNLNLIVVSGKVYIPPASVGGLKLTNLPWSADTWLKDIQKGDIVINPQFEKAKWKYKSNNKTTTAWALGLPVATTDKELDLFFTEAARKEEADKRLKEVAEEYDIKKSVREMKELILDIKKEGVPKTKSSDTPPAL